MGWVDIVFIVLIAIFAIIGLSKGLFESILGIFSSILSVAIAIAVSGPVSGFLNSTVHANEFFANLLVKWEWIGADGKEIFGKFYNVEQIGNAVSIIVAVVAVWLLIKLAIALLSKLFDNATSSNSALSGLNRVLGLVFGAAKGFLIGVVVLGLASILSLAGINNVKTTIENESKFTNFVYGYVSDWVYTAVEDRIDDILGKGKLETETEGEAVTVTFADGNQVEVVL
ncbi:MAG: CvpA family protein [Clostridia bacterium]|nr:CvpA family protein [Clostridia bacterium]